MSVYEYPDYYETFHCIGGACKDSCCAGWEVDVDHDSAKMYENIPDVLPIGARLKKELYRDEEGYKFHLTERKRCPFLNDENLCDLIIAMGEGALCVTCTEYPRYFCDGPEYEQVDLTLSCPEAVRLFYATEEPISYVTYDEPIHDSDYEEEPEFDEYDDDSEFYDEYEEEFESENESELEDGTDYEDEPNEESVDEENSPSTTMEYNPQHYARLKWTLDLRNQSIKLLQDRSIPLDERFQNVQKLFPEVPLDSDEVLLQKLDGMENVNPAWASIKTRIEARLEETKAMIPAFHQAGGSALENRMERFRTYLMYRYTFDYFYHEDPKRVIRFVQRCYRMLELLIADWCVERGTDEIPVEALEDCTRIFSRQVEHSKGNVDLLIKE